jgi:simple sugar transport system substrate-binding protein/ribose transport system substrate-binding protein
LKYAVDAAKGVKLKAGETGGGAPKLQEVSYDNDSNLADPIVAPFVTKTAVALTVTPVDGLSAKAESTAVTNKTLWGNVFGASHGGVCTAS